MNFESELKGRIVEAVQSLYSVSVEEKDIVLQPTRKEFEGDITLVVFGIAKASKKNNPLYRGWFIQPAPEA